MHKTEIPVSLPELRLLQKIHLKLNSLIFGAMYLKMEEIAKAEFYIWTKDQTKCHSGFKKIDTIFCYLVIKQNTTN